MSDRHTLGDPQPSTDYARLKAAIDPRGALGDDIRMLEAHAAAHRSDSETMDEHERKLSALREKLKWSNLEWTPTSVLATIDALRNRAEKAEAQLATVQSALAPDLQAVIGEMRSCDGVPTLETVHAWADRLAAFMPPPWE